MISETTRDTVLESAALGLCLLLGNAIFVPEQPGYSDLQIHPGLLAVALVAFRYGLGGALIAVPTTTAAHWTAVLLLDDRAGLVTLVRGDYATPVLAFCVLGAVCGALAESHISALRTARRTIRALEEQAQEQCDELESMRDTNAVLGERIVSARHSIPTLARISRQLHQRPGTAAAALGPLLGEIVGAGAVSVWSGSPLRCVERWGARRSRTNGDSVARLGTALQGGDTLALEDVPKTQRDPRTPFLLGRFGPSTRPYYVAVDHMDLDDYDATARELFDVIVAWSHDLTALDGDRQPRALPPSRLPASRPRARGTAAPPLAPARAERPRPPSPPRRSHQRDVAPLPRPGAAPPSLPRPRNLAPATSKRPPHEPSSPHRT